MLGRTTRQRILFFFVCGIGLVFPWFVPVKPALSESFALGFSNLAFLVYAIVVLVPASYLIGRADCGNQIDTRDSEFSETESNIKKSGRRLFTITSVVVIIQFVLLFIFRGGLPGYGESEYFLVRGRLMDIGLRPYFDFEYMYGPALLFGFQTIKRIFEISQSASYLTTLLSETIVGALLLRFLVRRIISEPRNEFVFACLFLPSTAAFVAGQNYTYFRFALPVSIAVAAFDLLQKGSKRAQTYLTPIAVSATFFTSWLVSPELAIAAALATFLTLLSLQSWRDRVIGTSITLGLLSVLFWLVPAIRESLLTMKAFAGGGNAFPAFPSPPVLIFLATLIASTRYLGKVRVSDNPVLFLLYGYSFFSMPSTLGRCDSAHLFFNSFTLGIICAKAYGHDLRSLRLWVGCCSIIMTASLVTGTLYYYIPTIGGLVVDGTKTSLSESTKQRLIDQVPEKYRSKIIGRLKIFDRATDLKRFAGALLIQPRSDQLDNGLAKLYHQSYFPSPQAPLNAEGNQRLGDEILANEVIIAPTGLFDSFCQPWVAHDRILSLLLVFPVNAFTKRNEPNDLRSPVCKAIEKFKIESEEHNLYVVYRRI